MGRLEPPGGRIVKIETGKLVRSGEGGDEGAKTDAEKGSEAEHLAGGDGKLKAARE